MKSHLRTLGNIPAITSIASSLVLATSVSQAASIIDDFNDGDDTGWTRYDPIGLITGGALSSAYSFPGSNSYRIQATPSPDPVAAGPSRAGAFRSDMSFTNFRTTVDLVDWGSNLDQGISLFARGSDFGPGTTDGYVLNYLDIANEGLGVLQLARIDNEVSQPIDPATGEFDIVLNPANAYRLVFTGTGADFTGEVFDLTDLNSPLATVTATDSTYGAGGVGVLTAAAVSSLTNPFPNDGTDVTFDNFTAVPEPGSVLLVALASLGLLRRNRKS